jgi:uncharacterized lipoprotein YddW (UPF0748 family)
MTKTGLMRVLASGRVLLLWLMFALPLPAAPNGAQAASATADSQPDAPAAEEMRGIWMWSSAVEKEGADAVANRLARYHINQVFFLVKGISGQVCYPSKVALASQSKRDLLKEMLNACHKRQIELHAWYVINCDNLWVKTHPDDAMWSAGEPATWSEGPHSAITNRLSIPVCPLSQDYRAYLKELVQDVVDRYPVDGIHLDVIRYQHARYCFCPRHQAFAAQHGIDLEKVRKAMYDTFYSTNKNKDYYFNLYRQGEPNVSAWVNMRQKEIDSIVNDLRAVVKGKNPSLVLSAAFMPEGAEQDSSFGICHYGQSYASAGAELDYILPMSYHRSFGKTPEWVAEVSINAESLSHRPVYSGIQAFGRDASKLRGEAAKNPEPQGISPRELRDTILAVEKHGIKGFVLFRYGSLTEEMWKDLPWNSAASARTASASLDLHTVSATQQPQNKTTD